MSLIYKISNDINDKLYIGKTAFSIEKRFKEHCADAFRQRCEKRPLYAAINKYGPEHFQISLIEECGDGVAEEREKYWIKFYDTYKNGYNATLGGDGKFLYDHKKIAKRLKEHSCAKDIAREFNCCIDLVSDIAKKEGISLKQNEFNNELVKQRKKVSAFDKAGHFVNSFISVTEAARQCSENKKCSKLNSSVRGHIAEVANGKRKTAYGYIWKYD